MKYHNMFANPKIYLHARYKCTNLNTHTEMYIHIIHIILKNIYILYIHLYILYIYIYIYIYYI
jgi:hypothetical protein